MSGPFDLDPAAWARLRRLLDQALLQPVAAREAWIAALPSPDAALSHRLRSLLAHAAAVQHAGEGPVALGVPTSPAAVAARLMQTLPQVETGQFAARPGTAEPAQQVGPYRLLHELGHGGMASVWLAERTDVLQGRRAAVKLPLGAWHGAGLAERLARERAILATLNHPHIAVLYDAGVDAGGRPWLALEYVEGERIDRYCERLQLDIPARLALLLQVAHAVAHAHARLVVHRDLKPGNVLVTADGQVKLLDFGIAKLLAQDLLAADETALTEAVGRALTPDYAAPEQILGQPVGTAADIYALGVMLYELLAGVRPYALPRGSRGVLEAAIGQVRPALPSAAAAPRGAAWQRALRGDLDTIVGKAMKAPPEERYATVAALADDLQRHLRGQPVAARPDRLGYRLRKFVSRHRLAVGAATATLVALLGGATAAVWQAQIARAEQRRAEDVKAFIASVFEDADPWQAQRRRPGAAELLTRARTRVDTQFATSPATRIELLNVIGASLTGLEEYAAAEQVLRDAAAVGRDALAAADPLHVRSLHLLVRLHGASQRSAALKAELAGLLPLLQQHESAFGAELVQAWVAQVQVDNDEGRYADMEASARQALAVAGRRLAADDPLRVLAHRALANALENQGRLEDARQASTAAYSLSQRLFGGEPRHPLHNDTRFIHARILSAGGDHVAALPLMEASIAAAEQLLGPDSLLVATMVRARVSPLMETHRLGEALVASQRALDILARHHAPGSVHLAYARVAHGTILRELRRGDIGRGDFEAAVRALAPELGADHVYTLDVRANAALARAMAGDAAGAADELDAIVQRFMASRQAVLDKVTVYRALAHRLSGRPARAAEILRPDLDTMQNARELARARLEMAEILLAQGQPAQALVLLQQLPARDTPQRPSHAEADLALGRAWLGMGQAVQALAVLQRADAFWQRFEPGHRGAAAAATWLARAEGAVRRLGPPAARSAGPG